MSGITIVINLGNLLEKATASTSVTTNEPTIVAPVKRQPIVFQHMAEDIAYKVPTRTSRSAAGYDLFASHNVTLMDEVCIVHTNVKVKMPEHMYGKIYPLPDSDLKGITVYSVVVDSDHTGEIVVLMRAKDIAGRDIKLGEKIARIIFQQYEKADDDHIEEKTREMLVAADIDDNVDI